MQGPTSGRQDASSLLDYSRKLGFTDAQYLEAVRRVKSADLLRDHNQFLMTLIEVSSIQEEAGDQKDTQFAVQQCGTSSASVGTSGYSSAPSFASSSTVSSSSQSLDSLSGQQQTAAPIPYEPDCRDAVASTPSRQLLRRIYVDGSNVARTHGANARFSWPGIRICVDWFRERGHVVKVLVPDDKCQLASLDGVDAQVLSYLDQNGILIRTPIECNDDMFIIDAARQKDGIIVSNDHYRDECRRFGSSDDLDRFIYLNRLRYVFDDDTFIPAKDPRGRFGPKLEDFLQFQPGREKQDFHEYLHRMRAQPSRSLPNRLQPTIVEERTNQPPVERLIQISGQRHSADRSGGNHSLGFSSHHSRPKPQSGVAHHKVARFQVGRTRSHNF